METFRTVREAEEYANWVYAKAGEEAAPAPARSRTRRPRSTRAARSSPTYAADADVTLDPRFGTVSPEGQYFPSTGGLSVPVTTLAKGGADPADPQSGDTSYVDSLPASQKCG